ncbi:MAG: hypothetical protein ACKODX_13540 [Gemmata sp.]
MFTRITLCRSVGITVNQLQHLHDMGHIAEPELRLGNARVYRAADVEAIRRHVEEHGVRGRQRGRPRKQVP